MEGIKYHTTCIDLNSSKAVGAIRLSKIVNNPKTYLHIFGSVAVGRWVTRFVGKIYFFPLSCGANAYQSLLEKVPSPKAAHCRVHSESNFHFVAVVDESQAYLSDTETLKSRVARTALPSVLCPTLGGCFSLVSLPLMSKWGTRKLLLCGVETPSLAVSK